MYRHDYIIRLIERFGAALRSLRDVILQRQREGPLVRAEIGEIARHAGLDLTVARTLDLETLLMWLAPGGEPDPAKLWLMAELLYLEGLQVKASGRAGWEGDLTRAMGLMERLEPDWRPGEAFTPAGERLAEIRTLLAAPDEE
jgi:hypothetical protein